MRALPYKKLTTFSQNMNIRNRLILFFMVLLPSVSHAADKLVFTSVQGSYTQKISESVLKIAYKRLGIEFEASWLPGKRALFIANKGNSDGEISRIGSITELYPELVRVNVPINYLEGMVYSKNPVNVSSWDSLNPFTIGIHEGMVFARQRTMGMDVQSVNNFPSLFKMLNINRIDVAISPRVIGLYYMIDLGLKELIANEPPIARFNLYHYLHKRHLSLVPQLEAILKNMEKRGEIDAIRSSYIDELKQGIIQHKPQ